MFLTFFTSNLIWEGMVNIFMQVYMNICHQSIYFFCKMEIRKSGVIISLENALNELKWNQPFLNFVQFMVIFSFSTGHLRDAFWWQAEKTVAY